MEYSGLLSFRMVWLEQPGSRGDKLVWHCHLVTACLLFPVKGSESLWVVGLVEDCGVGLRGLLKLLSLYQQSLGCTQTGSVFSDFGKGRLDLG